MTTFGDSIARAGRSKDFREASTPFLFLFSLRLLGVGAEEDNDCDRQRIAADEIPGSNHCSVAGERRDVCILSAQGRHREPGSLTLIMG